MKTKTTFIILMLGAVVAGLIGGCDNSGESNFVERYVLDGFMPLGHPIRVRLTKTVDISDFYDANGVGVTGAEVVVWEALNGDTTSYNLVADANGPQGTYIAPEADDTVKSGYDYSIRIEIDGQVITARTELAPDPIHVNSCTYQRLPIASFSDSTDLKTVQYDAPDSVWNYYELFFDQPARMAGLNTITECTEPDWFYNDDRAVSGNNGESNSNLFFWTQRQGDHYEVPPITLGFQGRYRVQIMSCDTAAYDYFMTLFPGDVTSNPRSNVVGALGLFSVFDADTVYFCVEDPKADVYLPCRP